MEKEFTPEVLEDVKGAYKIFSETSNGSVDTFYNVEIFYGKQSAHWLYLGYVEHATFLAQCAEYAHKQYLDELRKAVEKYTA